VLDAKNKLSAMFSGEEPAEERGTGTSNVQITSGGGGESGADGGRHGAAIASRGAAGNGGALKELISFDVVSGMRSSSPKRIALVATVAGVGGLLLLLLFFPQ